MSFIIVCASLLCIAYFSKEAFLVVFGLLMLLFYAESKGWFIG